MATLFKGASLGMAQPNETVKQHNFLRHAGDHQLDSHTPYGKPHNAKLHMLHHNAVSALLWIVQEDADLLAVRYFRCSFTTV